jgi:fused signal recognition particle receptor
LNRDPHTTKPFSATGGAGWLGRLRERLAATKARLAGGLAGLLGGGRCLDETQLEELEAALLSADLGVEATEALVSELRRQLKAQPRLAEEPAALWHLLRQKLLEIVRPAAQPLLIPTGGRQPFVIMVVGVNGVGKTTTIAKLAHRLKSEGRRVMIAAADTFRAAAVEQIKTWGERIGVPVVAQHTGADAAAVAHDALEAARARGIDVLIVDTAGRQHTHAGLMDELKKIRRVLARLDPAAPHEVLMVLDANAGQNALAQLERFREAVGVSGIALTKLDGTAKGGVLVAIARRTGLPIRYLGLGERLEDLAEFDAEDYVEALLPEPTT